MRVELPAERFVVVQVDEDRWAAELLDALELLGEVWPARRALLGEVADAWPELGSVVGLVDRVVAMVGRP